MTKRISVVIPCLNEQANLARCIESIENQDYPRKYYEIIVVDNGSTDNSLDIAQTHADRTVIAPNTTKVGGARNIGAKESEAAILVFIDSDCTIDRGWLSRADIAIQQDEDKVFGGAALLPPNANWIERHWLLTEGKLPALPKELIGCSIIIKKSHFIELSGFNDEMASGEDSDLSYRARSLGLSVEIRSQFSVTHWGNAKTVKDFIRRQIWHSSYYKTLGFKSFADPVFILILIWIMSFLTALISLTLHETRLFLTSTTMVVTIPAIFTIKRFLRAKRPPKTPKEALICYSLDVLYIIGRSRNVATSLLNKKNIRSTI